MGHPSDVLIGIDAADGAVGAAAFDGQGHQLSAARHPVPVEQLADGTVEQDPGATWQSVVLVLRDLAMRVPDLARRTVALAITGDGDGTWLIDEDGDPVGAAISARDRRAVSLVRRWRRRGVAAAVQAITGCTLGPGLRSAQLAWLLGHRPDALARADRALSAKDWLYFCCTGETVAGPDQAAAFGDVRTMRYDPRVLDLLGLGEVLRLLPEIVDDPHHQDPLGAAASAATGLGPEIPVFLGPEGGIATAVAAGLDRSAAGLACTMLGSYDGHARVLDEAEAVVLRESRVGRILALAGAGHRLGVVEAPGAWQAVDWLVDFAAQLLADAGLIGLSRDDVFGTLERGAATAPAATVALHGFGQPAGRGRLVGLSERTTPYDLVRAAYEAIGWGARDAYEALRHRPDEIRLVGVPSAFCRGILAAATGTSVRPLLREEPAATGAALLATIGLGQHASVAEAAGTWITPHLGGPVPSDPALRALYEAGFAAWRGQELASREDASCGAEGCGPSR